MRFRFKEVRATSKVIVLQWSKNIWEKEFQSVRFRSKVVRVIHFEISSPKYFKYFASFSLIRFPLRFRYKEVRVRHLEIPFPK